MMARIVTVAAALVLGGCMTMPRPEPMLAGEVAAICAVLADAKPDGLSIAGDATDDRQLQQRLNAFIDRTPMKPLSAKIRCDGKSRTLAPRGYGVFIDSYAVSPDGDRVALAGGFQFAPLFGGGGICIYRREGGVWKSEGCVHTWDS